MTSLVDDRLPALDTGHLSPRSITLPARPSAASLARSFIREHTVLDSMRYTEADLLITEMICNVVRHAGWVEEVELTVDPPNRGVVSISLSHDLSEPMEDLIPGAGFKVLDRLSHEWGYDHDGGRLVVWFSLRRPGSLAGRQLGVDNSVLDGVTELELGVEALLGRHHDLAVGIARRYRGKGVSDDDLEQVALMGLFKAIHRYDPARGELRPYAAVTISGELKRWLRDKGWSVRVPRSIQELVLRVKRGSDQLTQTLGREPTRGELAEHLGIAEGDVLEAGNARKAYASRSSDRVVPGTDRSLMDQFADDSLLDTTEDRLVLEDAIARLPHRQRIIVSLRFNKDMSQSEIADVVGISQVHVSRLLSKAFRGMRETLAALERDEE